MDNVHHSDNPTVKEIADEALQNEKKQFERKQKQLENLLDSGVSTYNEVEFYEAEVKRRKEDLRDVIKRIETLGFPRSLLTQSLGITDSKLNRLLPQSRPRKRKRVSKISNPHPSSTAPAEQ